MANRYDSLFSFTTKLTKVSDICQPELLAHGTGRIVAGLFPATLKTKSLLCCLQLNLLSFVLFVLRSLIICAARANFPEVGYSRIRILLSPRRQDAKRQAQGLSSRANARDLGKISLFVRNDNALPLRLCERYSETDRCAKRTYENLRVLRGENSFTLNPEDPKKKRWLAQPDLQSEAPKRLSTTVAPRSAPIR